jgi:hypothetical protein
MSGRAAERRQWLSKTLAGVFLGFGPAIALAGLFHRVAPAGPGKIQFVMWITAPLWLTAMFAVYAFRDARAAWIWFGAANAAAYLALFLTR